MSDVNFDHCISGWYCNIEIDLLRRINLLSRRNGFHQYVGIASNPQNRWDTYHHKNGWGQMYVIYRSSSWDQVRSVEKSLDEWLRGSDPIWWNHGYAHNEKGGGGGRRPTKTPPPYYVYILNAPKYNRFAYEFTHGR